MGYNGAKPFARLEELRGDVSHVDVKSLHKLKIAPVGDMAAYFLEI